MLDLVLVGRGAGLNASEWASWVQAIGSIAALAVAIYVMSRQNKHAARLLIDTDMLAFRRRAAGVKAIVERAEVVVGKVGIAINQILQDQNPSSENFSPDLDAAKRALNDVREAIKSIPAYELGSYDMAEAINLLGFNLGNLWSTVDMMLQHPNARTSPQALEAVLICITRIQENKAQFDSGAREFL